MGDKRKEELKKRAKNNVRATAVVVVMMAILALIGTGYLLLQFYTLDVIVPDVTIKKIGVFIALTLVWMTISHVFTNRKLDRIEDIVIENKIELEDGASMKSLMMDETLKLKEQISEIRKVIRR